MRWNIFPLFFQKTLTNRRIVYSRPWWMLLYLVVISSHICSLMSKSETLSHFLKQNFNFWIHSSFFSNFIILLDQCCQNFFVRNRRFVSNFSPNSPGFWPKIAENSPVFGPFLHNNYPLPQKFPFLLHFYSLIFFINFFLSVKFFKKLKIICLWTFFSNI